MSHSVCVLHRSAVRVLSLLQPPSTTDADRMAESEWNRIFQMKTKNLKEGDSWRLEFDEKLVPKHPSWGWKMSVRNTCARFKCSKCGRVWASNRTMVVFHMRLTYKQGVVKVKPLRQNCKSCDDGPMEEPTVTSANVSILLENLVEKIRIKFYHEDLGRKSRPFRSFDAKSPHEPAHCEACMQGICPRR